MQQILLKQVNYSSGRQNSHIQANAPVFSLWSAMVAVLFVHSLSTRQQQKWANVYLPSRFMNINTEPNTI